MSIMLHDMPFMLHNMPFMLENMPQQNLIIKCKCSSVIHINNI